MGVHTQGGDKTIIWTDTLQTLFMIVAVVLCFYYVADAMDFSVSTAIEQISLSEYSKTFFWKMQIQLHFSEKVLAGAFIAIVMTGLDQDMMQKTYPVQILRMLKKTCFGLASFLSL